MGNRRDEFMQRLIELAETNKNFVVLDADVGSATRTWEFGLKYPERFFEMGIAEQNMVGTASGFAGCGVTAVCATFATFISMRALEMIRTSVAYPKLDVKLIGGYAGISNGKDGATHQSLEDLALLRAIPNMAVITPADGVAARKCADLILGFKGPIYVRMEYEEIIDIYEDGSAFSLGGSNVLRQGKDVAIVACGAAVGTALRAAEKLSFQGIDAQVVDMYSIKPFDEEALLESAAATGAVVSIEEHSSIGGLAGAVCECLMKRNLSVKYHAVGINDVYTESGKTEELKTKYGIDDQALISAVNAILEVN